MKKQTVKVLVVSCLFVLMAGISAYAQEEPRVTAEIPFAFTVGNKTLPPGEYTIQRGMSYDPNLLLIRSGDNHVAFFLNVEATQARRTPSKTDLVFDHVGGKYFLSQMWVAGDDIGRVVPMPRAERDLEKTAPGHLSSAVTVTTSHNVS